MSAHWAVPVYNLQFLQGIYAIIFINYVACKLLAERVPRIFLIILSIL